MDFGLPDTTTSSEEILQRDRIRIIKAAFISQNFFSLPTLPKETPSSEHVRVGDTKRHGVRSSGNRSHSSIAIKSKGSIIMDEFGAPWLDSN
jgi:hypothetical protein